MRIKEKSENFEELKENYNDTSNDYDVEREEDSKLDFDFEPVIPSLEGNEETEKNSELTDSFLDSDFDPVVPSLEGNEETEWNSELSDSFLDSDFDPVIESLEPIIKEVSKNEHFVEETPEEGNFDDKEEDVIATGSEQDIWFGSQREFNYLFNKYLEYKKAGFTEEVIRSEKMPESVKEYQEMLKEEDKEREEMREKEQPEEEEDKYPGSQLEIDYMVDRIEEIEREECSPAEKLTMIAEAERKCQEMVKELERQREAEKKHKEWVNHQLATMDRSDEVEDDYKEDNILKKGDQEEADYLIEKAAEKIDKSELNSKLTDEEIKSYVEEMNKALTIDGINYDLDQIKKDYNKFFEGISHLSEEEREALEKEELVKELDRIPNDKSSNEFKETKEQNDTIIEQQVEQEQVLVQQVKTQEVQVDSALEQEEEKCKEESEQKQKDDISEDSQEVVHQKSEIQTEEDGIIEIQLEEQELTREMEEKKEEIGDEEDLEIISEIKKEHRILKVTTHAEQDDVIRQEQTKKREESIMELVTLDEEREEIIEELGVTTIKEEKDKIKEKEMEEREEELTEELLQEWYYQETGRRSIYAGRKTKGFCEWLEQQHIDRESTEVEEQVQEIKRQADEEQVKEEDVQQEKELEVSIETLKERAKTDWKPIFKNWINELASLMLNPYLTKLLKDLVKDFRKFEKLERIYNKYIRKRLTSKEKVELFFINLKLLNLDFLYRRLVEDILAFKRTYDHMHPYEVSQLKEKFLAHLSKKYRSVVKDIESHYSDIFKETMRNDRSNDKQIFIMSPVRIKKYGESYRIPHDYVLILSKYIFLNIYRSNVFNIDKLVNIFVEKLNSDNKSNFNDPDKFQDFIQKYVRDLVIIVKNFVDKLNSDENEPINISLIAKKLLDNGINLKNKFTRLKQNLRDIYLFLKKEIPDFKLEKIEKVDLKSDSKGKFCGICGLYKPNSKFYLRSDGGFKYLCKDCYLEKTQISLYKKEFRLIMEIRNGYFMGKCANSDCDVDFRKLPAIEIHHPKITNYRWREILKRNYDYIKSKLDKVDNTIPLCSNCHTLTYKIFYNHYRDLINDPYIFIDKRGVFYSTEEIDKRINKKIKNFGLIQNYNFGITKTKILAWLRKRLIINQLYDGNCANCGERDIAKLQFHHTDPALKKTFKHKNPNLDNLSIWKTFTLSDIKESAERVVYEECICLCANCHALITSKYFEKNSTEILKTEYILSQDKKEIKYRLKSELFEKEIINCYRKLRNVVEKEHRRIRDLKKQNEIIIVDPLSKMSKWELTLMYIYVLNRHGNYDGFNLKELEYVSGYKHHKSLYWVNKLFERGYLDIINETSIGEKTYRINSKGLDEALRICSDYNGRHEQGFLSFIKNVSKEIKSNPRKD